MSKDGKSGRSEVSTPISSPILFSFRSVVFLLGFVGCICFYSQRINLSVAMVCMLNHTALMVSEADHNSSDYEIKLSSCGVRNNNTLDSEDGEFAWSKSIQGIALGSFFWGYILTPMLGGYLSLKFGGKMVFGHSMLLCSLVTLMIPVAARVHYAGLVFIRFFLGFCQGMMLPAMHGILNLWAPPLENSRLIASALAGLPIGNAITLPIGGILCQHGFAGGWPSIFYTTGAAGILWYILWMILVSDFPVANRWMSKKEKVYIMTCRKGKGTEPKIRKVPWASILTSLPVWSIIVCHILYNWSSFMFFTQFPTYLREIYGFNAKEVGLISSLPFIGTYVFTLLSAMAADNLRKADLLSMTKCRKIFNSFGMLVQALLIVIVTVAGCKHGILAVTLLIVGISFSGCNLGSGFVINNSDIAPRYAGIIFAISNTAASLPGIVAPSIVTFMTRHYLVLHSTQCFPLPMFKNGQIMRTTGNSTMLNKKLL